MRLAMSWLNGIGCLTSLLLCNMNLVTRGSCLWRWIRMEVAENSRLTCLISLPAFPDQERMLLHWRMRTIMISLAWGDIELAYEYNAVAYWLLFPVSYYLCVFHNGVARHRSDGEKCQIRWDISLNRFRDKNPIAGRRKAQIAVAIYVQGNEYRLQPFTIGNCRFKDLAKNI